MFSEQAKNELYEEIVEDLEEALQKAVRSQNFRDILGHEPAHWLRAQLDDGELEAIINGLADGWTEEFMNSLDVLLEKFLGDFKGQD